VDRPRCRPCAVSASTWAFTEGSATHASKLVRSRPTASAMSLSRFAESAPVFSAAWFAKSTSWNGQNWFCRSAQRDAIAAAEAEVSRREAEAAYAADYLRRVEPLGRKFLSTDKVEEARVKQQSADAALRQARHERERAQNLLAQFGELNARREAAEAAVRAAELDVGYCRVLAPFDGYVTNLNIAVGQYARQGEQVFALVDGREWYVIANFKETYLDAIRPGMEAEVFLLSYPNRRFHGEVQGVGWALHPLDGATVGVLPAVQPSLNWVRLAQRFPVRIRLEDPDAEHPFRMGTTAVVTILGARGETVATARRPE